MLDPIKKTGEFNLGQILILEVISFLRFFKSLQILVGFLKTILVDHFGTSGTCYGYSSYKRKRKDDRNTYLFNLPRSNLNYVCDFSC